MIPEQLKRGDFRFILIKPQSKNPIEKDWTKSNNYSFDDFVLEKHIHYHKNYGIVTGFGNLIVIDFDDQDFQDKFYDKLPSTFTVKSGSGKYHLYYITDNPTSMKLLDEGKTLCDIQGKGRCIIAPNSIHPNGNTYLVVNDVPINDIKLNYIKNLFKDYLQKDEKLKLPKITKEESDDVIKQIKSKITLPEVLSSYGVDVTRNPTTCIWHEFKTGNNFSFNNEVYYCHHCLEGGNMFHFVMKQEKCSFSKAKQILATKAHIEDEFLFSYFDKYTNILEQMKKFVDVQPIHYDNSRMWWVWNKNEYRWMIKDETDLITFINENTKSPTTNATIKNELLEGLKQIGRRNVPKPPKKTWIQFKDKIIDYVTGEEFEASPEYFITNPIPWELGETDETTTMDLIFEDWVGKENVQTLYEIIAYSMLPDYPIHRLFCFIGAGLNGKTSYLRLLSKSIGDENTTTTELDYLLKNRFEITKLHKKLVCIMGETNFNELNQTSILKRLTGQDRIGFEYKNKNPFDDYNYAKILIATNNLPTTTDKSIGFYRRWLIIDFSNVFSEKKDILDEIPEIEFNNLARKSMMILKDLMEKREFTNEGSIEHREKMFEEKSNPLEKFWKENVEEEYDGFIFSYDFKKRLDDWCKENKFRMFADQTIGKFMKEKHIDNERHYVDWTETDGTKKRYRAWMGVKWRE